MRNAYFSNMYYSFPSQYDVSISFHCATRIRAWTVASFKEGTHRTESLRLETSMVCMVGVRAEAGWM